MFQIDEKSLADGKTLVSIQRTKADIRADIKNGTINFTSSDNNLWLTTSKIRQEYIKKSPTYLDKLDRILTAANGTDIEGSFSFDNNIEFKSDVSIKKNLVIKGNLLVEGTTTTIDTPNLSIEDNIIELNRNETSAGITLGKAGLAINRGTGKFARTLFSETDKAFVTEVSSTIDGALSADWITKSYSEAIGSHEKGELEVKNLLNVPHAKISGTLNAEAVSFSTLNVSGSSTFNGSILANNTSVFKGMLTANGQVKINNTLDVTGATTLKNDTRINKSLTVDTTSLLKGVVTTNNKIITTAGGIDITGVSIFKNALTIKDNVTMEQGLGVATKITTNSIDVATKAKSVELQVTGLSALNNVNATGSLTVQGHSIFNANITAKGIASLEGSLTVKGETRIENELHVKHSIECLLDSAIGRNCSIGGKLSANGGIDIEGDQTTNGNSSALEFTGDNYRVRPIDGNGIEFWTSNDKFKISMSSTGNSTLGGAIVGAASSDYNMYFDMKEGSNRGFVFKNNGSAVFHVEGSGIARAKNDIYAKGSKVLCVSDEGHGKGIDADTLDGKHHSDLTAEFVNVTGDRMTGKLTIETNNNQINAKRGNNLLVATTSSTDGDYLFGGKNVNDSSDFIKHYIRIGENKLQYNTTSGNHNIFHEGHKPQWSEIEAKPATFPPSVHNHHDLYYTEAEINTKVTDINNKIKTIEDKIGSTKTVSVNIADWVLNSSTGYYEETITHNMNININSLEVRFFDENNTSVMVAYDFVNNNSIKIYNDEACTLTAVICGVSYLNRDFLDTSEAKIENLNKKIESLERLINKTFNV